MGLINIVQFALYNDKLKPRKLEEDEFEEEYRWNDSASGLNVLEIYRRDW